MQLKLVPLLLLLTPTFLLSDLKAANRALAYAWNYQNPWGPTNPQSDPKTGFASWFFDHWNPPNQTPAKPPFFIDRHTWAINVPADTIDALNYDAAWISFTGDGVLDVGQTFSTGVVFTVPGPYYGAGYGIVPTPTEGIDFMAQSSTKPSAYDSFGHQVVGIYLGPTASGPVFTLAVHPSISDEGATIYVPITPLNALISAANTASNPLIVDIAFTQQAQGQWMIQIWALANGRISNFTLSSVTYGPTWNTAPIEGIDAVRYFTSQGGATPGGPLEWSFMSVR